MSGVTLRTAETNLCIFAALFFIPRLFEAAFKLTGGYTSMNRPNQQLPCFLVVKSQDGPVVFERQSLDSFIRRELPCDFLELSDCLRRVTQLVEVLPSVLAVVVDAVDNPVSDGQDKVGAGPWI